MYSKEEIIKHIKKAEDKELLEMGESAIIASAHAKIAIAKLLYNKFESE